MNRESQLCLSLHTSNPGSVLSCHLNCCWHSPSGCYSNPSVQPQYSQLPSVIFASPEHTSNALQDASNTPTHKAVDNARQPTFPSTFSTPRTAPYHIKTPCTFSQKRERNISNRFFTHDRPPPTRYAELIVD